MPNPDASATPISQLLRRLCGGGVPASGGKIGGQLGQAVLQAFEGQAAQLVGAGLSLVTLAQHCGQGAGTANVNSCQPAGLQGREGNPPCVGAMQGRQDSGGGRRGAALQLQGWRGGAAGLLSCSCCS